MRRLLACLFETFFDSIKFGKGFVMASVLTNVRHPMSATIAASKIVKTIALFTDGSTFLQTEFRWFF